MVFSVTDGFLCVGWSGGEGEEESEKEQKRGEREREKEIDLSNFYLIWPISHIRNACLFATSPTFTTFISYAGT